MTLKDLIDSVLSNVGDRQSGKIGGQTADSAVLQAINFALPQCVKLSDPEYYNRSVQMTLPSGGGMEWDIPTTLIGTKEHRIKDIIYTRASRVGGTGISINKVTWFQFMTVTPDYDQRLSGIPSVLSFREGKMFLNRNPSEDLRLTLFVEVWPRLLTVGDASSSLPIGVEWELALEAFATHYCYLKLQQVKMSEYWRELYDSQRAINTQVGRKTDIRGQGVGGVSTAGQPWLNPFTNNYN